MTDSVPGGPPSPEEFQRQLAELMRQTFSGGASGFTQPNPARGGSGGSDSASGVEFAFNQKPREVKAYLDRFVIRQEEAKKVLSVALCDHYHHVRLALEGQDQPDRKSVV